MTRDVGTALRALHGIWEGSGEGRYPTIEEFTYSELTHFEFDARYPLVHFEQRTLLGDGEPGHWESGFIRWQEDGTVEISTAQDGGRVEVLAGPCTITESGFRLEVDSVALGHDPRLVRTRRVIEVTGDTLSYEMGMATTTTPEPVFQNHLRATLERHREGAMP